MLTYCGDHFEMYGNIASLSCVTGTNSVVGRLFFKNIQTHRKRDQTFGLLEGGVGGGTIG